MRVTAEGATHLAPLGGPARGPLGAPHWAKESRARIIARKKGDKKGALGPFGPVFFEESFFFEKKLVDN